MTALSEKFSKLVNTLNSMSLQERVLLLVVGVVILHLIWNLYFFRPFQREGKQITDSITEVQKDVERLELEAQGFQRIIAHDPDADNKARIQSVQKEIDELNSRIKKLTGVLISPEQMVGLLEELLVREQGLQLVKLENLEPHAFIPVGELDPSQPSMGVNLFQHGFIIEFEGDFHSTLSYLKELEKLPWQFFWDAVIFDVQEYPQARVRIELHTLGLSEGWIGV
jgi:MSHA biogenesis protein MshJ